jgi:acylphosphatase/DNA-directed RNA polymerase subunit RPC12/RpoP
MRPFVYALARPLGLGGFVANDTRAVTIEIEGDRARIQDFLAAVQRDAPPLAAIHRVGTREIPSRCETAFAIVPSEVVPGRSALVSPDVATCADCLREVFDPDDRRYRYAFTNCTNCGPRFTIVCDVPYDRATTTMAGFAMCPDCAREYHDPRDRRFHAQPIACPACGPRLALLGSSGAPLGGDSLRGAVGALRAGSVVAVNSVVRALPGAPILVRRARGYAPRPVTLPWKTPHLVLACGAELKSTVCLTKGGHAFVSHHLGDLENYEAFRAFTEAIAHYRRLFDIEPEVIAAACRDPIDVRYHLQLLNTCQRTNSSSTFAASPAPRTTRRGRCGPTRTGSCRRFVNYGPLEPRRRAVARQAQSEPGLARRRCEEGWRLAGQVRRRPRLDGRLRATRRARREVGQGRARELLASRSATIASWPSLQRPPSSPPGPSRSCRRSSRRCPRTGGAPWPGDCSRRPCST